MLFRLFTWTIRSILRGPGKSWVFASGTLALMRLVERQTGRRELVDLSKSKPGDKFVIEHLGVSHKEQMKHMKSAKKIERQATKQEKKAVANAKRELKRARRANS